MSDRTPAPVPVPFLRRPTRPPNADEIPDRILALEESIAGIAADQAGVSSGMQALQTQVSRLASSVDGLSDAIRGPENEPRKGLLSRVDWHDGRARLRDKIVLTMTITLCTGAILWFISKVIVPALKS